MPAMFFGYSEISQHLIHIFQSINQKKNKNKTKVQNQTKQTKTTQRNNKNPSWKRDTATLFKDSIIKETFHCIMPLEISK